MQHYMIVDFNLMRGVDNLGAIKVTEYGITTHFYEKIYDQKRGIYVTCSQLKILALDTFLRDLKIKYLWLTKKF